MRQNIYIINTKMKKTCGVIYQDDSYGIKKIAEPVGIVAAVIPTTNPTSTAIFKTLIALKTRNGIIISPHPRAQKKVYYRGCKNCFGSSSKGRCSRRHYCMD